MDPRFYPVRVVRSVTIKNAGGHFDAWIDLLVPVGVSLQAGDSIRVSGNDIPTPITYSLYDHSLGKLLVVTMAVIYEEGHNLDELRDQYAHEHWRVDEDMGDVSVSKIAASIGDRSLRQDNATPVGVSAEQSAWDEETAKRELDAAVNEDLDAELHPENAECFRNVYKSVYGFNPKPEDYPLTNREYLDRMKTLDNSRAAQQEKSILSCPVCREPVDVPSPDHSAGTIKCRNCGRETEIAELVAITRDGP